jgi:hypothetical protein
MFRPAQFPIVFDAGSVWVVAAGSGEPEFVTPHGLRQRESIVHDRLASGEIFPPAAPLRNETVAPAMERLTARRHTVTHERQQPRSAG